MWVGLARSPATALAVVACRLPSGAAFAGLTAAWLHGLDVSPCAPIEVVVPRDSGVSAVAGALVRRAWLGPDDVVERRGLPTTPVLRTLADIGRQRPLVEAVVVADMVLRMKLVSVPDLNDYIAAHPGTAGIVQLRRVVELAEPDSESPMETRLRLLLVLAGLPRPRVQVTLRDDQRRFLGRPDLYYDAQRLGLEYDGGTHRISLTDDNRRQNRLVSAGFRLLRFTRPDVMGTPDAVVKQVRDALGLTPGRPTSRG
jgi:hypothetical protein